MSYDNPSFRPQLPYKDFPNKRAQVLLKCRYVWKEWLIDGRVIVGKLKGYDQTTNVIMEGVTERIYSADEGVSEVFLGLYIIRGDNVALIGELDEEIDTQVDYPSLMAEPIPSVQY